MTFNGNGGSDSSILFDTDGDDTLSLRPFQADMIGAGYKFNITDVDRIYIHATAGGQDVGYIYDSAGDDRLTVRPQFSSIVGPGYFNYISGIERLYAYATAGGRDVAELYDSTGNDRFSTSGDAASIVGPGFSSYTKFFEQVNVFATAAGDDVAALYGSGQQTQWQRGSDFVSFSEETWSREARGFERVDAFLAGQAHSLVINGLSSADSLPVNVAPHNPLDADSTSPALASPALASPALASPAIEASAHSWSSAYSQLSYNTANAAKLDNTVFAESVSSNAESQFERLLLAEIEDLQKWDFDRLELPEEPLLTNPTLERALLDKIFRWHDDDRLF